MHSIAVTGHVCVDIRPDLGSAAQLEPGNLVQIGPAALCLGGSVGNTGADLAALGLPVRAVTTVGDDELGTLVQVALDGTPLVQAAVRVLAGASTSYSLILEPAGADRTIWHHVGANAAFDGADLDLAGTDLVHLGYPPLLPALLADRGEPLVRLLAAARAEGRTTSVDLAVVDRGSPVHGLDWASILARMAAQTDVLSPSLDDLTSVLGIDEPYSPALVARLADQLLDWGVAVAAISAGEHGLYLKTGSPARLARAGRALAANAAAWADRSVAVAPFAVEAKATTNGAGDASTAGLLFGLAAGAGAEESARLACACSAALVGGRRTTPGAVLALCPDLAHLFT